MERERRKNIIEMETGIEGDKGRGERGGRSGKRRERM